MRIGLGTLLAAVLMFGAGALRPLDVGRAPAAVTAARSARAARTAATKAIATLQRSRAESDPSLLPQARRALRRSLELQPRRNLAAAVGMASLANASHDFRNSVRWSRRAIRIDPYGAAAYGLLGDALFELGRYEAADAAYQTMVDTRPDVASYVRASYAAQSHSRWKAAEYALKLAIDASPRTGEEAAWLHHQLGDVYAARKMYGRSLRVNRIGTKLAPGYVPPTVGVAETLIATNDFDAAIPIMERAVRKLPSLEYIATLGDLYWVTGERKKALEVYDEGAAKLGQYRAAGVLPDVDFVTFYADHGYRLRAAPAEARAVYRDRPTSAAADALAWALRAAGRDRAAMHFARRALATARGPDATQQFHAGVIAIENGKARLGRAWIRRALHLDPNFSLFHRATARRLARP